MFRVPAVLPWLLGQEGEHCCHVTALVDDLWLYTSFS